jgi:hypothetical protein
LHGTVLLAWFLRLSFSLLLALLILGLTLLLTFALARCRVARFWLALLLGTAASFGLRLNANQRILAAQAEKPLLGFLEYFDAHLVRRSEP